ncbi:MAG: hypothetical protein EHM47_12480 [Ignavibacteriales bacterium]|nr:MAG: hypothetical protein EHM47_12480 [Ignavibacteriales bacterium]
MINKILIVLVFIISLQSISNAQSEINIGINAGGGFISANSPNEGVFTSGIFIGGYLSPGDYISTRLGFIYAADFNSIIPESSREYYPSVKGFYLKGIYSSFITGNFYTEQGLGLLALHDKIYSDRNNWDFGIVISLLAGIDFREYTLNGFRIGLGLEYGLTFLNYSIQYYSTFFQLQYVF